MAEIAIDRMGALLISNRPPHSGIGVYTRMLHEGLLGLGVPTELYHWDGRTVERFYSYLRSTLWKSPARTVLSPIEEAMRVLSQVWFFQNTPTRYPLYHITNAALAQVARRRRPSVVTVHDLVPYVDPRCTTDRIIRRSMQSTEQADRVICVSEHTRREVLENMSVDESRVRVVQNGVHHDIFRDYPVDTT